MLIELLTPQIVHISTTDRYWLADTFLRMQEFYESPFEEIRGQYFDLETYMDLYAKEFGNFTYHSDWGGFNIPGESVREFFHRFPHAVLTRKEIKVKDFLFQNDLLLKPYSQEKFYVVGAIDYNVFKHEMAHAFYYLDSDYREEINSELEYIGMEKYLKFRNELLEKGYCSNAVLDEMQAYLVTSTVQEFEKKFTVEFNLDFLIKMQDIFNDRYKKIQRIFDTD
jgi:hypothetical protein